MNYTPSLDQERLAQLANQYLGNAPVTGDVVFFADEGERLSHATWQFPEKDQDRLRDSGFKSALLEMLDELISHRASQHQANLCQGVVNIEKNQINIRWLPLEEAQALRNPREAG
ncbi:hypothetical protein MLC59_04770 [Marinobacter bryozoorum]|uniref:hypothetical protein n=1 Tax=Marinobacter bryozoorum TaxID=256324 RepID=UPI002005DAB9|nr:hypothetical protein [Marinobacter bryozoorum]MCK7543476.1 hypothetical protein [Marinobacter bryozoorum]